MEQQIHFCRTDDAVRIAYATVGAGPPLVKAANWLSHLEFDWSSAIWRHVLTEFARDHMFIRYDERGSGLADWNVADCWLIAHAKADNGAVVTHETEKRDPAKSRSIVCVRK